MAHHRDRVRWPLAFLFALSAVSVAKEGQTAMETVRPADNGAELRNPGMGWVLHYYDNVPAHYGSRLTPADTLSDWPGLNLVYLRIPWSFIEPREGVYNWSVVDTPMQRFAANGVPASFRFTCSESWMRYATPEWVREAGARGYNFRPGEGITEDGPFWEPDYDDPVFLAKLDRFLGALARRYDGNPDVAFLDIGSFGVWGEGHTWSSTRKEYPVSTIERHIELHLKHFRKTPLIGMDDFLSRPGTSVPLATGLQTRSFDLVVPVAWWGRRFAFRAGLWQPGRKQAAGRLRPLHDSGDMTTRIGELTVSNDGVIRAAVSAVPFPASASGLGHDSDFAIRLTGIRQDRTATPHSLKVDTEILLGRAGDPGTRPFLHLLDPETGEEVFAPREEREDDALASFMAERGLGLRDDSILVQPPPSAYFHAAMAQRFWRNSPVVLECEHYGGSAQRGCWQDGSGFLQAVEDYHASYASIHWWPAEFLEKNRDLVRRINLRLGYRFQLVEVAFPEALALTQRLPLAWRWRNAGVSPPLRSLFPAVTLRDRAGGIAAVFVDDSLDLRKADVAVVGDAPQLESRLELGLPFQLGAGDYGVFVSVGDAVGKPLIALPMDGDDGSRRYRLGTCRITGDFAMRLIAIRIEANSARIDLAWTAHRVLPDSAIPFLHLEHRGRLLRAVSPPAADLNAVSLRQAGEHRLTIEMPLGDLSTVQGECTLLAGLWQPERIGRADERLIPDQGQPDRRVPLGTVRFGQAGEVTVPAP